MREPVLSIVMPCLDGMPHLPAAIASARRVFGRAQVEIVVADGGSTDGSAGYLRGEGVVLVEGADTSLYDGLNKALSRTRAPYVAWLNSDDTILDGMAGLLEAAQAAKADMATGEAEQENAEGGIVWTSDHNRRRATIETMLFGIPTINSRIFSRRLLERAGPFRTDIGLGADRHMLVRMLRLGPARIRHDAPVYRYRLHEGSRTMAATWGSYRNVNAAHLAMIEALSADGWSDEERDALDAFACVSRLAAARASLFSGEVGEGLRVAMDAVVENPMPGRWMRGLRLRRSLRGHGSGW